VRCLRWFLLPVLGAALALAAGCGGGGTTANGDTQAKPDIEVPANAVAVVADTPILRTDFDRLFKQLEAAYKAQQRDFPKPGTAEYEQLKNQTMDTLVGRVELAKEAETLGVTVTDDDVTTRLEELKQQFFGGDEQAYQDEIKAQGLTEEDILTDLRAQIISKELFDLVTKDEAVTDAEVDEYYADNEEQFTTPESREVAHILVDTKKLADDLYQQLQDGAKFAELAKKYSTDTGSAEQGGKLTDVRGSFVPEFEQVAFALETGEVGEPVKSQFGWHVIKALADTKPKKTTPLGDVRESIKDQLLQDKKNKAMAAWVEEVRAKYAGQVAYATGFAPPTTATLPAETGQ
jgi:foldase protein PrsA